MNFKARAMAVSMAVVLTIGPFYGSVAAKEPDKRPNLAGLSASDAPAVTLSHWVSSTDSERYAFLLGFVSMVDLERTWQANKPVSLSRSLVRGWSTGFEGMTLGDIDLALQNHARNNPQDLDKPVIQMIWQDVVQPRLSEEMRKEVRNAYYGQSTRKGR